MKFLITFAALASLVAAAPASLEARDTCYSGVKIIVARGTTEPQGFGLQGVIVSAILNKIPNSNATAVVYPASFDTNTSLKAGVTNAQQQITSYYNSCPNNKIVLMGYSQGAEVIGDSLTGGGTTSPFGPSPAATPISQTIGKNVVSVVLFGDPNRVKGQGIDSAPTSCTVDSPGPRTGSNYANMQFYANRLDEYCSSEDMVCCKSTIDFLGHLSYFSLDNANAVANFVAAKFASA